MANPLKVEFQFDFGSPNAYLAELVIPSIERRTGVKFDYVPVLLGGVYKATGNMSPADSLRDVKNKPEYNALETQRLQRRGERAREPLDLAELERRAEIRERRLRGEPREARFEQRDERRIAACVDLGGHARRVRGEPRLSRHRAASAAGPARARRFRTRSSDRPRSDECRLAA